MIDPRVEELLEQSYIEQVEQDSATGELLPADVVRHAQELGYVQPCDCSAGCRTCQLTPAGLSAARDVVRRHRLAECLLRDVLGVSAETVDRDACRFEHIIQAGLEEKICLLLGHPLACPHGRPIPPGECCDKARTDTFQDVTSLADGTVGAEGSVAYLSARDQREIQKLMAVGVLPGIGIILVRKFPSFVFQIGYSQFTVDRELAQKIMVRWNDTNVNS